MGGALVKPGREGLGMAGMRGEQGGGGEQRKKMLGEG